MTQNQKRVQMVLGRMNRLVEDDEDYADFFIDGLGNMLEELAMEDAFGTECQSDPRGDGRDGDFTMTNVQGVDDV